MPPRTKIRVTKVLKENIDVVKKNKLKSDGRITKTPRKALADKTNSLSDDNASIDIPIKTSKKGQKSHTLKSNEEDHGRLRRERRLPPRYVENQMLKKLSNSKDSPVKQSPANFKVDALSKKSKSSLPDEALPRNTKINPKVQGTSSTITSVKALSKDQDRHSKFDRPAKNAKKVIISTNEVHSKDERITTAIRPRRNCRLQSTIEKPDVENSSQNKSSPFKTPPNNLECSLIVNRPKRIRRLPSKFEDHSISPNKFIPVQPCHASTPILHKNAKTVNNHNESDSLTDKEKVIKTSGKGKPANKPITKIVKKIKHTTRKPNSSNSSIDKSSPDSNNNGKSKIIKSANAKTTQLNSEPNKITTFAKRVLDKSISFRLLEDKKQSNNLDVYEFTFDPDEEPPPQKKKRKRTVKKKTTKPRVVLKNNYNDNLTKVLANLKNKIKPSQGKPVESNVRLPDSIVNPVENIQSTCAITKPTTNEIPQSNNSVNVTTAIPPITEPATSIHESNYASIRVEDIAADFDLSDHHNDINYSPINSPTHQPTPEVPEINESHINPLLNKDPLNLQEDLSFFDEQPVASSSMNVSVRHPLASPWRVEFGNLPMKWHSNTYVKPNMTPAVESSFINSEDMAKKKHVYTNMVPEEPLPEIVDSTAPNLKQPSIISFIREVAERTANKKKRRRSSSSHENGHSIFDDITKTSNEFGSNTPKKSKKTSKDTTPNMSSNSNDISNVKENINQPTDTSVSPDRAQKTKDKDCTYFGFDDSENVDQENVSPVKIVPNTRTRGLRSRPVLKEFNARAGPSRPVMPVAAKSKLTSSEVVEQLYDQLKSTEDAAQFPEKVTDKELDNTITTNIDDPSWHENDDDSQSVHLFEDIELIHHFKPHRKSYGKAKKVTFQQPLDSDSDSQPPVTAEPDSSSDDDLDLTFQMPDVKPKKTIKKKKPKKQLTKKEKKAVEEWAAGFNSMCEDIEEFPLVVE